MSASPRIHCLEAFPAHSAKKKAFSGSGAFSLVEVSMALGVIAIAFIAMMGMLPVGMNVFRESKDSSNENWIFQVLQAKVLATDWKKLMPSGTAGTNAYLNETYYFDDEGRFVRLTGGGSNDFALANADFSQLYMAKIINGQLKRPSGAGITAEFMSDSSTFAVLLVNINNKAAVKSFEDIKLLSDISPSSEGESKLNKGVRVRTFVVSKMDSTKD